MKLTFTQLKQIRDNGYDIRESVEQLNDIPEWAHLNSISEIQAINQCGCAANAHISCFYADARDIFVDNTVEIEEVLMESGASEISWDVSEQTFDQFVSNTLQIAVESIAFQFADMFENVDWD